MYKLYHFRHKFRQLTCWFQYSLYAHLPSTCHHGPSSHSLRRKNVIPGSTLPAASPSFFHLYIEPQLSKSVSWNYLPSSLSYNIIWGCILACWEIYWISYDVQQIPWGQRQKGLLFHLHTHKNVSQPHRAVLKYLKITTLFPINHLWKDLFT